jgi:uncharacterized protein GlcG (DUF336 family)
VTLHLAAVRRGMDAAQQAASDMGEILTLCAVDAGAHLIALVRMDGAGLASLETCIGKAYTAAATGAPTAELFPLTQPGQPLFGFAGSVSSPRPFVTMPGGVPIFVGRELVGAIGVAGARDSRRDHEVALVAIDSIIPRADSSS